MITATAQIIHMHKLRVYFFVELSIFGQFFVTSVRTQLKEYADQDDTGNKNSTCNFDPQHELCICLQVFFPVVCDDGSDFLADDTEERVTDSTDGNDPTADLFVYHTSDLPQKGRHVGLSAQMHEVNF